LIGGAAVEYDEKDLRGNINLPGNTALSTANKKWSVPSTVFAALQTAIYPDCTVTGNLIVCDAECAESGDLEFQFQNSEDSSMAAVVLPASTYQSDVSKICTPQFTKTDDTAFGLSLNFYQNIAVNFDGTKDA